MRRTSCAWRGVAAIACLASPMAFADNPLGVYVGAGVGESTVRSDNGYGYNDSFGYGGYYSQDHHFAWKVAAGIRPIPAAGAELEYIDFGHPGSDGDYYSNTYYVGPDSHPRAIAAFGVGHLPLPLPFLDVFGKLGVARLHTNVDGYDGPACFANQLCPQYVGSFTQESRWDTRVAYGVGLQTRFANLSIRAEYERISSPYGDPDLFSIGATWTF